MKIGALAVGACLVVSANAFADSVLYTNGLPTANVNTDEPVRSNIAFGQSDPTAAFNGDTFTLPAGSDYLINSLSTWSIASVLGQALGFEFSEMDLYIRVDNPTSYDNPWTLLSSGDPGTSFGYNGNPNEVGNSNPDITSTNVTYSNGQAYLCDNCDASDPSNFFPLWENTFGDLNLVLVGGVTYDFAVNGVGVDPDPTTQYGFWYNSFSNARLGGAVEDGADNSFLTCNYTSPGSGVPSPTPCFIDNPFATGDWNKGADMNVELDGSIISASVPEPATYSMFCMGLAALGLTLRRRRA